MYTAVHCCGSFRKSLKRAEMEVFICYIVSFCRLFVKLRHSKIFLSWRRKQRKKALLRMSRKPRQIIVIICVADIDWCYCRRARQR